MTWAGQLLDLLLIKPLDCHLFSPLGTSNFNPCWFLKTGHPLCQTFGTRLNSPRNFFLGSLGQEMVILLQNFTCETSFIIKFSYNSNWPELSLKHIHPFLGRRLNSLLVEFFSLKSLSSYKLSLMYQIYWESYHMYISPIW